MRAKLTGMSKHVLLPSRARVPVSEKMPEPSVIPEVWRTTRFDSHGMGQIVS